MIARIWHGATPAALADDYVRYLSETGVRRARATRGNSGVLVLRRLVETEAEFVFTSFWESREAIHAFAGPEPERAVYFPRDREFLLALEPSVAHYDVVQPRVPDLSDAYRHILRLPA